MTSTSPNKRGVALLRNREWGTREAITAVMKYARIVSCPIILLLAFLASSPAQTAAGSPPLVTSITGPGNLVKIIPFAPVIVCSWPSSGVNPCTNLQQTYTDPTAASSCPTNKQVIFPGTNSCANTSDSAGNFSFFATAGNSVAYYFKYLNSWYGPYVMTLGGGSGGGGGGSSVPLGNTGQVPVMNQPGTAYAPQTKAILDARDFPGIVPAGSTNCTLVGPNYSGCVDSYAALQAFANSACLGTTANGASVIFPKNQSASNGIDYYSSRPIVWPKGCQVSGVGNGEVERSTVIAFAAGEAGFVCVGGCTFKHITLLGGNPYTSGSVPTVLNGDGVQAGSNVHMEDMIIAWFPRHGVMCASDLNSGLSGWPTQFDSVIASGVQSVGNLGDGFHCSGNDGESGTFVSPQASGNQGYGFNDTSLYGNIWLWANATGNGTGFNAGGHGQSGATFIRPYAESNGSVGQFCNSLICAAVYEPQGQVSLSTSSGVAEAPLNVFKQYQEGMFVVPANSAAATGDQADLHIAFGWDEDAFGMGQWWGNADPASTSMGSGHEYSFLGLRRNYYGSGNNGSSNASNCWAFMKPGSYNGALATTSICLPDNLTNFQRSAVSAGAFMPNGFYLGSLAGNYIPTNYVGVGTAAPTTGSWLVGDRIINSAPTRGSPWAWRNVVAGTPGTWVPETFSSDFTGSPWYDITIGAACDGVTDDHVILQVNLTAAAGGFAYIPALKQCETSVTLTLPTALQGFWIGPGAQLQASATITGHGVIEQGGVGQRATNPEIYGGGVIDANGKADYVAWFHNFSALRIHDIFLKNSNVNGLGLGDGAGVLSNNPWVHHVWIDRPSAISIPSGSVGLLLNNISDSESIDNNTIVSFDQGIQVNGNNHWFAHNHVSGRFTYTQAFTDNGTGNHWESNEADSPGTYGFRIGSTAADTALTGNTVYNNSTGPDNTLIGISFAAGSPTASVSSNFFYGYSASHRIATDISASSFTNVNLCGNQDLNVVTINAGGCGGGSGPGSGNANASTYWATTSTLGSSGTIIVPAGASSATIQTILSAAGAGQEIQFTGTYSACSLTLTVASVTLRGLDTDGAVIQCATAGVPVLTVSGNGDIVKGLNLKHITNSPTCPGGAGTSTCGSGLQIAGGASRVKVEDVHTNFNYNGFDLGWTTYSEISNSISEFNNNHGIAFVMDPTHKNMQWQVSRVLSEQNLGNGLDMTCPASFTSVQTPGPYITGWSLAYGNAGYGFNFSCSAATTSGIADVWINGAFASANNASGFRFDLGPNGGRNLIVDTVYSEQAGTYTGTAGFSSATQSATNVGYGIEITSSCDNTPSPVVTGGTVWGNSYSGIVSSCAGTAISNINSYGNGAASASAQTEAGVTVNAANVQVNGGYFKKGSTQTYGVYQQSGDTPSIVAPVCDSSISAANCVFAASQPTNGYQQWLGQALQISGTGVPSMACSNGWRYHRTDAGNFATGYSCINAAWVADGSGGGLSGLTTDGVLYATSATTAATLTPPTANGNYTVQYPVTGGVAVAPVASLPGIPNNPQTGTTYTVGAANTWSDRGTYISLSNASAIAVTLPAANSTGFTNNWTAILCDIGVGTATITPTTSTISYSFLTGYSSAQTTLVLTTGQCAVIYSDNTNYFAVRYGISSGSITNAMLAGSITLANLATQAADTMVANMTAGSAAPTAVNMPTTAHALWVAEGTTTPPAAVGPGTAGQFYRSAGSGADGAFADFPEHLIIPAANCNNATAGAGWSIPASNAPTVACRAGTNNLGGALQWANNNTTTNAQFTVQLPFDWDTATQPYINIIYGSGANTSGTVKWTFSSACTKSDGSITDDPSFVAETTTTGKTMATANRTWSENVQFANVTSGNNCIAGSQMIVKVTSGNGTAASSVNVYQVTITVPRLSTVQAN